MIPIPAPLIIRTLGTESIPHRDFRKPLFGRVDDGIETRRPPLELESEIGRIRFSLQAAIPMRVAACVDEEGCVDDPVD